MCGYKKVKTNISKQKFVYLTWKIGKRIEKIKFLRNIITSFKLSIHNKNIFFIDFRFIGLVKVKCIMTARTTCTTQ